MIFTTEDLSISKEVLYLYGMDEGIGQKKIDKGIAKLVKKGRVEVINSDVRRVTSYYHDMFNAIFGDFLSVRG